MRVKEGDVDVERGRQRDEVDSRYEVWGQVAH